MMQTSLQKSGPSPYSLSVMAGVLLIAVTAYPKSLDESVAAREKANATHAHHAVQASAVAHTLEK